MRELPENTVPIILLGLLLVYGVWCALNPESVVRFRRRLRLSDSQWTGGWNYATPKRVRAMGILISVLSYWLLYGAIVCG